MASSNFIKLPKQRGRIEGEKKQFLMQVTKASRGKLQSNIISSEFPRILQLFPVIFSFSPWNDTSDQKWFWLMNVNTNFLYSEITIYKYKSGMSHTLNFYTLQMLTDKRQTN